MIRAFKYKLRINKLQRISLEEMFEFCRFLYNCALEERIKYHKLAKMNFWKKTGITHYEQALYIKDIRKFMKINIYAQVLLSTLKTLDEAYHNFFRKLKSGQKTGFPRFKSKNDFKSIIFPQITKNLKGKGGIRLLDNNKINIFGVTGDIHVVWHRPFIGKIKRATIKREGDNYFLILTCQNVPKIPLQKTNKDAGIDVGVINFITIDDGNKISNPKFYKKFESKISNIQSIMDKKEKNLVLYARYKKKLQNIHKKISNSRLDFHHKTANELVRKYDSIYVEELNVKQMLQNGHTSLNKFISDCGFYNFRAILGEKAERGDKLLIKVDPKNTSKTCSSCLYINNDLTLNDRIFTCKNCFLSIDRDVNAALNIKRVGINLVNGK